MTTAPRTTKTCARCWEERPIDEYVWNRGINGYNAYCRGCAPIVQAEWRDRTGDPRGKQYQRARGRALTRLAHAHPDEFAALLAAELEAAP